MRPSGDRVKRRPRDGGRHRRPNPLKRLRLAEPQVPFDGTRSWRGTTLANASTLPRQADGRLAHGNTEARLIEAMRMDEVTQQLKPTGGGRHESIG